MAAVSLSDSADEDTAALLKEQRLQPHTALRNELSLLRSEVLVVPDQQEVFVSDCGKFSVIIEVLEHPEVPDQEAAEWVAPQRTLLHAAAYLSCSSRFLLEDSLTMTILLQDAVAFRYFFNDLSRENSAISAKVSESRVLDPAGRPSLNHTVALLKGEFDVRKKNPVPDHVVVRLAVIRIPEHRADILITMHETTSQGSGSDPQERAPGNLDAVIRVIIDSFQITNYGLFA
ncbi:hypothetical protein ACSSS7_000480 [Eimeria intestinalis]